MSVQSSKFLFALALTGMLGPVPARMFGQTAAPSSAAPQKNWKDRAEYDLYVSIGQDTESKDASGKAPAMGEELSQDGLDDARRTAFLTTYAALNDPKDAVEAAKEILADIPEGFYGAVLHHVFHAGFVRRRTNRRKCWMMARRLRRRFWPASTRRHPTSKKRIGPSCGRKWNCWRIGIWDGSRCSR